MKKIWILLFSLVLVSCSNPAEPQAVYHYKLTETTGKAYWVKMSLDATDSIYVVTGGKEFTSTKPVFSCYVRGENWYQQNFIYRLENVETGLVKTKTIWSNKDWQIIFVKA